MPGNEHYQGLPDAFEVAALAMGRPRCNQCRRPSVITLGTISFCTGHYIILCFGCGPYGHFARAELDRPEDF